MRDRRFDAVTIRRIRAVVAILGFVLLWPAHLLWAQLAAPNQAGVSMGQFYYHVSDLEAAKQFWIALGGQPIKVGTTDAIKFPEVLIVLASGGASGGATGSVLDHIGFRVPHLDVTLAALQAAGLKITPESVKNPNEIVVLTPDGDRVEIFQELTGNTQFKLDEGQSDLAAQRHNQKMTVPMATEHFHLFVPAGAEVEAQKWYVKTFGAVPGSRFVFKAADLPGIQVNISAAKTPVAPSKGRTLDRVGFEVKNLEAFCRDLQAGGVKFDVPYAKHPDGIATAFLTDPWGTYIELTEGLSRF
jgi:catechol 2,3-dioxygenase-like lactoylglutathione lyase family enzyme